MRARTMALVALWLPLAAPAAAGQGGGNAQQKIAALQAEVAELRALVGSLEDALGQVLANPVLGLGAHVRLEVAAAEGLPGPHVIVEGANLHVRSGSGASDDGGAPLGLGNVVIGYDADDGGNDVRSGSHNLVIGDEHSFSSTGGLLSGFNHDVSGLDAVAVGGQSNRVGGAGAVALGGFNHDVTGDLSLVAGGQAGDATALSTTVVGGSANVASAVAASVFGGGGNEASGVGSVVSGGSLNLATGPQSAVHGGLGNEAAGELSVVSGGQARSASGLADWVAGLLFQDF